MNAFDNLNLLVKEKRKKEHKTEKWENDCRNYEGFPEEYLLVTGVDGDIFSLSSPELLTSFGELLWAL